MNTYRYMRTRQSVRKFKPDAVNHLFISLVFHLFLVMISFYISYFFIESLSIDPFIISIF